MLLVTDQNKQLTEETRRLKTELTTAKTQEETLTQMHDSVQESLKTHETKLAQSIEQNQALKYELDEIRRNQAKIDKSEVTGILARVKVSGVGYTLLQENTGKSVWHADQQIVKIQE